MLKEKVRALRPGFWGLLMFYVIPIRRAVVLENLNIAFGAELDPQEIKRLAKAFYRHLMLTFWENLFFGWKSRAKIKRSVRVEGVEKLFKEAELGRGVLTFGGHYGNWETGPVGGMMQFEEFRGRFHMLRRQIVNKWVERQLFRRYYQAGLDIIPKRASLNRVMDALANNHAVGFIMDQYAKPGKEGILVDFFGRPAGTFKSLAVVARVSEARVLPVACWREPDGTHVLRFLDPINWIPNNDPDAELLLNTLAYNRVIESIIREHPDQWLWLHKRWKNKGVHKRKSS
jgi:KDO2-lipid IV(A) lauroyltransferase